MTTLRLLLPMLLLAGCASRAPVQAAFEEPEVDTTEDQFPIWAMTTSELSDLIDGEAWQPRIISFYDLQCGACRSQHELLRRFQGDHPEIKVVLVNLDDPTSFRSSLLPYLQQARLDKLTHVRLEEVDPRSALRSARPELASWPVTLFVQPNGSLLSRVEGDLGPSELEQWSTQLTPPAPLR